MKIISLQTSLRSNKKIYNNSLNNATQLHTVLLKLTLMTENYVFESEHPIQLL